MTKFKIGDRVRILSSIYDQHPSRMAGGTGTVVGPFGANAHLAVDGEPAEGMTWLFTEDELELLPEVPKYSVGDRVVVRDYLGWGDCYGTVSNVDRRGRVYARDWSVGAPEGPIDPAEFTIEVLPTLQVGDRVRFIRDSIAGGARFGAKGDTAVVTDLVGVEGVYLDVDRNLGLDFEPLAFTDDLERIDSEETEEATEDFGVSYVEEFFEDAPEATEPEGVYYVSVPVPNGMKLESVNYTFA